MGNALKEQGKLEETIEAYNKALAIKPDYADAYYNMGNTLKEQGKMEEAIEAYNKAISLKPDYADAYSNMGNVLKGQGKLKEAIEAYNKALAIKPDNAEAYNNMGNALKDQGKLEEAIEDYKKALAIKPDYADAFYNMGNALQRVVFRKPSPSFQNIITSILDYKTFVKPSDISSAAISLLKFEPVLRKVLQQHSNGQLIQFLNEAVLNLSKLPLLLKLMTVCPIADLELEDVLRDIRSSLLSSVSQLEGSPEVLRFQSALALQCFTNEYIYEQTDGETKALKTLKASVKKTLSNGKQPSPQFILCLASYKALHGYEWCDFLAVNRDIEEVVQRQVIEPRQEARIKPNISVLEEITDTVSSKVREQYEESPYPRWVNLGLRLVPAPIEQIIEEIDLRLSHPKINGVDAPNILIAGCGTGQHSIGTASRFKNSKVLAIDLSLSSLAYAKRKTEELGIQNIEYMQADILDLSKLKRQFDIVESVGVLHHMDEPMAGWRVLTDCLKPGGLMMIGLYSEFARQGIVEMREEIGQVVNGSSDFAMKTFRNSVINSDKDHHNKILTSPDFYSLSTLRDLLFHVQEHRFTISQIKDCLRELGLEFCGFEADKIVQNFKLNNTRADDPYDLDKWNSYEESNANTFGAMYQFWCQKLA
jgi:2-polyprenyl-3-methyl-5-hydroxy-6-metoxy-1,4-benzoquinol methylase/TolA-binding protein